MNAKEAEQKAYDQAVMLLRNDIDKINRLIEDAVYKGLDKTEYSVSDWPEIKTGIIFRKQWCPNEDVYWDKYHIIREKFRKDGYGVHKLGNYNILITWL